MSKRFLGNFAFLLTIFLYACSYQQKVHKFFQNKTLLYSYNTNMNVAYSLYAIIEKRGDSIYRGAGYSRSLEEEYQLRQERKMRNNLDSLFPIRFNIPYVLKRKENRILLSYKTNATKYSDERTFNNDEQYLIDDKDSSPCVNTEYLCDRIDKGYSKYQKDTIIKINNQKLNCWIFKEFYAKRNKYSEQRDITITSYIEKSTLIPIKVSSKFYDLEGFKKPEYPEDETYIILRSVIPKDSLRKNLILKDDSCIY